MFNLIQLGWADGGPFVDFCSFGTINECYSLLCLDTSLKTLDVYVELCGFTIINTFSDEDE